MGASEPAVLVADIEGTLTDKSGRETGPRLLKSLSLLEKNGVPLILCSGRGADYMVELRRKWGLDPRQPAVAENGCSIFMNGTETPTYNIHEFDRVRISERLRATGAEKLGEFDPVKKHEITLYPKGFIAGNDYTAADIQRIYKFVRRSLEGVPCNIFYTSASGEVLPEGVDKGTGLKFLFRKLGRSPAEALFLGDGQNDLPAARYLLGGGGLVGVPANGHPELKQLASLVSDKEYHEGASDILEHFFTALRKP